jgi:anti-sigma B factor antagonist
MKISEQRQGAVTVLKPEGPLIDKDAADFKSRAGVVIRDSMGRLVLDMSGIPFVDSKGLEVMVDLAEEMAGQGQALKLSAIGKTVREVLEITELVSHFDHFEDVNSAIRSFL